MALEATRQMVLTLGHAIENRPAAPFDLDHYLAQRLRLLGRTGIALMACAGIDMAAWDALEQPGVGIAWNEPAVARFSA